MGNALEQNQPFMAGFSTIEKEERKGKMPL